VSDSNVRREQAAAHPALVKALVAELRRGDCYRMAPDVLFSLTLKCPAATRAALRAGALPALVQRLVTGVSGWELHAPRSPYFNALEAISNLLECCPDDAVLAEVPTM